LAQVSLNPLYAFFASCIWGLLFGLATTYVTRRRGTEVDPIEPTLCMVGECRCAAV
jgi:hypothetical protein